MVPKVDDHLFKLMLGELAVCDAHPRLGHELLNMGGDRGDRVDAIMDEEDLAVAQELPADRRTHLGVRVGANESEDRLALFRGSLEDRHFTDPGDRHF